MQALLSLMDLGFDFWIEKGKIRYKQKIKHIGNETLINGLLADIKIHRQEAVKYLLDLRLTSPYQEKLSDVSSRYQSGGLPWLRQHKPELYNLIGQAWDRLNDIWNQCIDGQVEESDFEQILNEWYRLQIGGIELYKQKVNKLGSRKQHRSKKYKSLTLTDCSKMALQSL